MASKNRFFTLFFISLTFSNFAFYIPGNAPREFMAGDGIEVKAIKLTSVKTVVPYEYYSVGFCKPPGDLHYKSENLGEVMRGDRIVNTPYEVFMKKDVSCQSLCSSTKNPIKSLNTEESEQLRRRIAEDYHVHLLVDNLPCATKYQVPETGEIFYDHGYKLGWTENDKLYVNNHLEIILKYHEPQPNVFRVVGFEVQPKSIVSSKFTFSDTSKCTFADNSEPQEVTEGSNEIAWTYSIRWESSDVAWASRWDNYLSMKDVQIHWFSILNSIIVIACLTGFLSVIIVRTVRRDIAKYNNDEEEDSNTLEETGWKLVHGDVFRPPRFTTFLVCLVGSGIQIFGMTGITVTFAMLGMLSPSNRGSLTSAAIVLYCFMGVVAGYHSGRLYKTFRGNMPKRVALKTALLFPSIILGTGFFLNFFLIGKHSSGAIPFTTMIAILALLFGIDLPLVFLGFHFGFRKQAYSHPTRTNQIPRQVPDMPWYLSTYPCMFLAGILPFGAVFIELYFIFSAIWENQFYYLFGFLFIVCGILFLSCALISIVVTYFRLCSENYRWWWNSFIISGGSAFYVMAYSVFYYYTKLNIIGFIPTLLYFAYSGLISLTFALLTGTIGFYASYLFLQKIYSAVKLD